MAVWQLASLALAAVVPTCSARTQGPGPAAMVRRPLAYPRQHTERLLTSEQCSRVRARAVRELRFARAKVGSGSVHTEGVSVSQEARRARYAPVPKDDPFFAQLYAKLWQVVNASNERLWRFSVAASSMETMQYSIYSDEEQGMYDWHEDVGFHSGTASRVLSVSVQLSEEDTYEGGDLVMRVGRSKVPAPRDVGTLVLFPSHVTHRVTPVSTGERHSLVLWIQLDVGDGGTADGGEPELALECSPLEVEMPDGRLHRLRWRPAFESAEEAARSFCQEHAVPSRHIPAVVRQIAGSLRSHCEQL